MTAPLQNADHIAPGVWRRRTALVLMLLLLFRLAALAVNRTDLVFDEAQYWSWAQEPGFGYFSKPPMLAWIIGVVTGLCGDGEACVRAASPLLYAGTGLLVYFAAEALYGPRTGFWAAVVFSTVPGVSFSAGLISTDVPLLFFWSAGLLTWIKLLQTRGWKWAVMLGCAIGLGLNAKYAMAYFFLCMAVHLALTPDARWLARNPRAAAITGLPLLFILPNILWNTRHGFITFVHTADNAKWHGSMFHPVEALEFLAAQFGVFGPILFAGLLAAAWRGARGRLAGEGRLLLHISLPVILLVLVQAFLSRAHANWAAVAYPAASILVTDMLLRSASRWPMRVSLGLHGAVMVAVALLNWGAPVLKLPGRADPYKHALGWRRTAEAVRDQFEHGDYRRILTEDRWVSAELIYYLRDSGIRIVAWRPYAYPRDHYELTRRFTDSDEGASLLVTLRPSVDYLTRHFQTARELEPVEVAAGRTSARTVRFFRLEKPRRE